jgi:hypothetical protein
MIEIIKELPDNVVGILARGRVTKEECNDVLRPAMEGSLKRHGRIRLYYEIGCRFPGAGWDDLEIAIDHLPQWERVAVVTDTGWVRHTVNALRFLIASEVRVFTTGESAEGRAWIASPSCGDMRAPVETTAQVRGLLRPPSVSPPQARRPSARPTPRGDRRYRYPSAGDQQSH